eukprot:scaffold42772_cov60-Phaeocystis_antarctica.AAC.1
MALRGALLCIACTVAASSWPQWPDQPLSKGEAMGVQGEHLAAPQMLHAHRMLAEVQAPSSEETALYHIIAWSSLIMVLVSRATLSSTPRRRRTSGGRVGWKGKGVGTAGSRVEVEIIWAIAPLSRGAGGACLWAGWPTWPLCRLKPAAYWGA